MLMYDQDNTAAQLVSIKVLKEQVPPALGDYADPNGEKCATTVCLLIGVSTNRSQEIRQKSTLDLHASVSIYGKIMY